MADAMEDASVQRVTSKQREVMVTFMQENPALATGRFKTIDGAKHKQRLTKEFSDTLNAVADGATKIPEKWMKCWQDWKSDIKKKAGKIKRHANGTGGGPPCQLQLTQLEEDVIAIMGEVAVGGQEATDPLDAQLALLRANAKQPEPEPPTAITELVQGDGLVVLQAMPVNTWMDAVPSTSTSTNSSRTTPLPTPSPVTSEFSEPSTVDSEEGQHKHKRKRSEGGNNLTRSQEAIVRNANSLDRSVQIKESRLHLEMKKLDHEMAMREKEIALKEKEAEAASKSASAMESMAMAVTAAMQTFQAYLSKQ